MARGDPRISKMWEARWRDADGREHYRTIPSATEAATLLAREAERGGVPIGEPAETDDRWYARWRDARGKPRKLPFTSYGEARRHLLAEDAKRARGEFADPKDGRRTLAEMYALQSSSKAYAAATITLRALAWNRYVAPELGHMPIVKIDPTAIEAVLASVEAPEMRAKVRQLLGTLFAYAVGERWLTTSPVHKPRRDDTRAARIERRAVEAKDRKRYLTEDVLARLLREIPEQQRALVELMARMGLRPGEAHVLTVGKFDPTRRTLLIDTSLSGFTKTGEARTLTLPKIIAERLRTHIEEIVRVATWTEVPGEWSRPEAPMFPKGDGSARTPKGAGTWAQRVFRPATVRAGLGEGFTPNSLRHSAVAFAIAHGADVYSVQQMVGHAKPSITLDTYGSLWDSSAERLAERLDEAIRAATPAPPPATVTEIGGAG
jgi:integrase